jgi:hypothetical protein
MVDITINASPRTIRLKGIGTRLELPAAGTILPGSICLLGSANTVTVWGTAGGHPPKLFALENELIGKGIDDNYVSGDLVQMEWFTSGDWVLAYVAAAATALTIGAFVEADGAGGVRLFASGTILGVSMDALDNSGGANIARVRIALT